MNNFIVGTGYRCISKLCSNLNCSHNQTCQKIGRATNFTCIDDPCVLCHKKNSKGCVDNNKDGNFSCDCKPGYSNTTNCYEEVSCLDDNVCMNGGKCGNPDANNLKRCNCTNGEFCLNMFFFSCYLSFRCNSYVSIHYY